jgi:hypothetical protein
MTDTIKTGTMLIEEGTLTPESLRFEREPWAPFYRAGEIIRELRNASGKQSKHRSEGNMAHSNIVKRCEDGGMKDDRYQSSNPTQTSNCRRQLLRNNGSL